MDGPEQERGRAPEAPDGARRPPPGETPETALRSVEPPRPVLGLPSYGRYVALLAIVIVVLITINTIATKPNGDTGIPPGTSVPPFAVPLATGNLPGDADVATRAHEGLAGNIPACQERGPEVLNICQLYERGPVVLALFVDGGSCPQVLSELQALVGAYPRVSFAAVAIKGATSGVRRLIRSRRLSFPVGLDRDGSLAALYKLATCPQVSFIERGGVVQSRALLRAGSPSTLRARVASLAAGAGTPPGGSS